MARVLFVDDDPLLLESLRCALGSDFQLVTASSGDQALEILRETGPFPVVVSRLRTPGMGGVELLSRVRRLHPDSSRIMLTGHADLEVAISA
ncbi:response regulator, partial [bacterium]|nr:response regulator [bacterium]